MYAFISASVAPCFLASVEKFLTLSALSDVFVEDVVCVVVGIFTPNQAISLSTSLTILSFFIQGVSVNAASPNTLISLSDNTHSFTPAALIWFSFSNVIFAFR